MATMYNLSSQWEWTDLDKTDKEGTWGKIGLVIFAAEQYKDNHFDGSIVLISAISNIFKQNQMQNVDSVHFQQNTNISAIWAWQWHEWAWQ